jgi:hypothetical protein
MTYLNDKSFKKKCHILVLLYAISLEGRIYHNDWKLDLLNCEAQNHIFKLDI